MPNAAATPHLVLAAFSSLLPSDATAEGRWLQLLPAGRAVARDGRTWVVGDADRMQAIVTATVKRLGATELPIDYDHQSVFGAVPGVGGTAPASGWIKELQVRPDGIWGRVEWTAAAAEKIRAGEYRYLSPVFRHDAQGAVSWIFNATLTNTPALDLPAVAASEQGATQEQDMKPIAVELGLAEDASEDTILAAVRTFKTLQTAVTAAVGLGTASTTDAVIAAIAAKTTPDPAKFVAMSTHLEVQTELSTLKAAAADDKATAAVDQAVKDGKVAPVSRDAMLAFCKADPKGFETFAATAPKIVDPAGSGVRGNSAVMTGELDEGQLAVCRALGITPEEFKKSLGEEKR